jgi:uridine kinase
MEIKVRIAPGAEARSMSFPPGILVEDILNGLEERPVYPVFAARLNNRVVRLDTRIETDSSLVFLDVTDPSGRAAQQDSMVVLYLRAVSIILPGKSAVISNSLNDGLFTFLPGVKDLTDRTVLSIENCMKKLAASDVSLKELMDDKVYESGIYVPRTGFLSNFELRRHRSGILLRFPGETNPDRILPYTPNDKLYDVFAQTTEWGKMLGIEYFEDLNRIIREGGMNDIIRVSEALHEKHIAELATRIAGSGARIVLIAGPSSSGKTSFAKRLCTQLWANGRKPLYLGTDDYFIDRDKVPFEADGTQNFEDLSALDVERFNKDMNDLLAGKKVDIPRYDFIKGVQVFGENVRSIEKDQIIVIEGIHGLNGELTPGIPDKEKFRIYISPLAQISFSDQKRFPLTDIRKLRRIIRDAAKRGWTAKQTMASWYNVRRGEAKNIFPFSNEADEYFNSNQIYELAVLKAHVKPLLEAIEEDDEYYCEAQRLLGLLAPVEEWVDDSVIPNDSILREFIGGSVIA